MSPSTRFAETCSRFSRFLKQRSSLGDSFPSSLFHHLNPPMNFFPESVADIKSLDLFPLTASSSSATHPPPMNIPHSSSQLPRSNEESKTSAAKMTIFYGGQVLVFDDLAEDRAEEIMSFASQFEMARAQTQTQALQNNAMMGGPNQGAVSQQGASLSDLPMARRVSLHRFMEKRKDRIAAASPYQLQRSRGHPALPHKYDLMMRHLRQKQQQHQELELKLF